MFWLGVGIGYVAGIASAYGVYRFIMGCWAS